MTNEERAEKLLDDVFELHLMDRTKEVAIKDILSYADEIRRESAEKLIAVREKLCGIELNFCNYVEEEVRALQNNMLEGVAVMVLTERSC